MKRIAVVGGGIAGVTATYELARNKSNQIQVALYEASPRLGGIVETIREGGFIIEGGPDGWVSEKPWARELAVELGLGDELISSNDEGRRTYVLIDDQLKSMPDGMRMMVPSNLAALDASELFSPSAKQEFHNELARAAELKDSIPTSDESVASFVRRHFGDEVLAKIGAPLLSGVFGGDVNKLSVRAVMAPFVQMERDHGSLIAAVQSRDAAAAKPALFTTIRSGLGTLVDRMVAAIPPSWIHCNSKVTGLTHEDDGWSVDASKCHGTVQRERFDTVLMAAPVHVAAKLIASTDPSVSRLMQMEASSAVIVAFGFDHAADVPLPPGFGFLVPPGTKTNSRLMACTFMDQKFPDRVPAGGRLLRAFFGGDAAERLMGSSNDEAAAIARLELAHILGPLPAPRITVVRRLPLSLPQYGVGHLQRMTELDIRINALGNLCLLGNGYRGVGLPDLIRDAKAAARSQTADLQTRSADFTD